MIEIKSKKFKVGNKLVCKKGLYSLFIIDNEYEIVTISDSYVKMMDEDRNRQSTILFDLDKDIMFNVFDYFKIW